MDDVQLRLIGGSHAGKTYMIHPDQSVLRLPVKREQDLSAFRADSPVMPISVKLEIYVVLRLDDAYYGLCEPLKIGGALNAMWPVYKTTYGGRNASKT